MKLTKQQQEQVITKLQEFWKDKICEVCGNQHWTLGDTLFELREFHGGKTVLGSGAIKPLITIACSKCGNTKLMNAIKLGIVDPKDPSGEAKEGGQQ